MSAAPKLASLWWSSYVIKFDVYIFYKGLDSPIVRFSVNLVSDKAMICRFASAQNSIHSCSFVLLDKPLILWVAMLTPFLNEKVNLLYGVLSAESLFISPSNSSLLVFVFLSELFVFGW